MVAVTAHHINCCACVINIVVASVISMLTLYTQLQRICQLLKMMFTSRVFLVATLGILMTTGTVLSRQDLTTNTYNSPKQYTSTADAPKYVIIIDPSDAEANDSESCHPNSSGGNSSIPCKTLDYAFQQFSGLNNSVMFYLASSDFNYTLYTTFKNVNSISIVGKNETVTVHCQPPAGLAFLNASNVVISHVRFVNCGYPQNSTSRDFTQPHSVKMLVINVSLYFYQCTNVDMYSVEVSNSSQATGVVMYDTYGQVRVNGCTFYNNTADVDIPGGGGFAVEFTYCSPGDESCPTNYSLYNPGYRTDSLSTEYTITGCRFENNIAQGQEFTNRAGNLIFASLANHTGVGRGGGLSIYYKGVAVNKSVSITNCLFINNKAEWGGGLLVEMDDNTMSNKMYVSSCNFTKNHAFFYEHFGTGGGALRVVAAVYFWNDTFKTHNYSRNEITVVNCNFTKNRAIQGGAISLSVARQSSLTSYFSQVTHLLVSGCNFTHNKAQLGSAVTAILLPVFSEGFVPRLDFSSCEYNNNHINTRIAESAQGDPLKSHPAGMGAVYVDEVPVIFSGNMNFTSNHGSALAIVGAQVDFSGTYTMFFNNSGTTGGAIALLGASSILIGPHTTMFFADNHASIHGGAIYNRYISKEDLKSSVNCFIRYNDAFVGPLEWKSVNITFYNNMAKKFGNSIYSSATLPCSWGVPSNLPSIFCIKDIWSFGESNCINEIFTEPQKMQLRRNDTHNIDVFPGRGFELPLDAFDDLGHKVTSDVVYVADIPSEDAEVEAGYTYVANNYIGVRGQPESNVTMTMYTAGSRTTYIDLNLTMKECPPGFVRSIPLIQVDTNNSNFVENISCQCPSADVPVFRGYLRCLYHSFISQIKKRYWIGHHGNDTELVMGLVPQYYSIGALYGNEFIDISSDIISTEKLCGRGNRSGTLCGKCADGYAVAINSPKFQCVRCDGVSLKKAGYFFAYIALTYVPIFLLFLAIIFFNFKLTSSAALSFVLYAQMIGSGVFSVTAGEAYYVGNNATTSMEKAYTAVYGLFNLNSLSFLMDPFCVSSRLTTLDVLAIEYAIAAFPLVMIASIYLFYRCKALNCRCYRNRRRRLRGADPSSTTTLQSTDSRLVETRAPKNTLIHAFVAFLFLSYTKFSLASMFTMSITELFASNGTTRGTHFIYFAGHLTFSDHRYLVPYGFLAILVFIFIVILPPLLLLGPIQFIDWLIDKRGFRFLQKIWPSIKVHTFLDTFQGFYKPNRRFFSGVYFLFRIVVFVNYSFSRTIISQYVVQQIAVTVLIVLVALFRPYTREFYNYLDLIMLLNLSILNALAIYIFTSKSSKFPYGLYAVECVLVWWPLVYMLCYAVWNRVHKRQWYVKIKKRILHLVSPLREGETAGETDPLLVGGDVPTHFAERSLEESVNFVNDDPDESMFRRASKRNRYAHSIQSTSSKKKGSQLKVSSTVVSVMPTVDEDLVKRDSGTSTGSGASSAFNSNDS